MSRKLNSAMQRAPFHVLSGGLASAERGRGVGFPAFCHIFRKRIEAAGKSLRTGKGIRTRMFHHDAIFFILSLISEKGRGLRLLP
jgi:hypothetical protein